jgi:adenylylsulfate kinase
LEKNKNIIWQAQSITRQQREQLNHHKGAALWFTGLSGAGKSTLANATAYWLHEKGYRTYVLDGDNMRHGLNKDLGFSERDREENIRRIGEVARLFVDAGIIVLCAFISPFASDRGKVRALFEPGDFVEIFCKCPLEVCEDRDPKGLYRRARAGEIKDFTGVSSPYEMPANPDLAIYTDKADIDHCVQSVIEHLRGKTIIM